MHRYAVSFSFFFFIIIFLLSYVELIDEVQIKSKIFLMKILVKRQSNIFSHFEVDDADHDEDAVEAGSCHHQHPLRPSFLLLSSGVHISFFTDCVGVG